MWYSILGIIAFILILGLIVLIHECGHFIMARRAGILCYEFAIGMGPVLWSKKVGETVYSLRAIPIGGFVSMAGEEVDANPLKGYTKCSLEFQDNVVTKIIVGDACALYPDLTNYNLLDYDIIGTKLELPEELYVRVSLDEDSEPVTFEVAKDAIVQFSKKQKAQIAPYNRVASNKSLWQRFTSVVAGPLMNFVLAFFVFLIIGLITGYPNEKSTNVSNIIEDSPAYLANINNGDRIVYIGDIDIDNLTEDMYYTKWNDISVAMDKYSQGEVDVSQIPVFYIPKGESEVKKTLVNPGVYINVIQLKFVADGTNSLEVDSYFGEVTTENEEVKKGDVLYSINGEVVNSRSEALAYFYNPDHQEITKYELVFKRKIAENEPLVINGLIETYINEIYEMNDIPLGKVQLAISPEYRRTFYKYFYEPFVSIGESCLVIFKTLGALIGRKGVSIKDLSGPVGIASATIQILKQGPLELLNWIAMLSVNVGFINLLPLPALDGGRLAFLGYEAVTRKKPSPKVENIIHFIGLVLLMALFVVIAFSDIIKLFK